MKRLLLSTLALVAMGTSANAADIAAQTYTKAPAYAAPVYNWSGFYAGGFGGYGWADANNDLVDDLSGSFGGGTVGYNWQMNQLVLGIEAEYAAGKISKTTSAFDGTSVEKVDAFGSITGRLGWAANNWLFYGKGGYGWVDHKFTGSGNVLTDSQTHSGYVIGGGVEWAFARDWSVKTEYLLYHADNRPFFAGATFGGLPIAGVPFPSGDFDVQTVKVGINYHFNWGKSPVIAKY